MFTFESIQSRWRIWKTHLIFFLTFSLSVRVLLHCKYAMPVNGNTHPPLAKVQYMCDENINTPRGQRTLMKYRLAFTQYLNGSADTPICFALLRILNCTRGNDFLTQSLCRLTNEMLSWLWAIYICDCNYSLAFSFLLELPSWCYLRSLTTSLCNTLSLVPFSLSVSLFLISLLS